jgi:hypothetical protein
MIAINRILALGLIISRSATAQTPVISFHSGEQRTVLLELYTSEGCSSCPPAEAWLSRVKSDPGLWRDLVPVAFHVDYWNHLGWRDPWSAKEFSDRQYAYAAAARTAGIYTPEFLVNGKEWREWSAHQEVPKSGDGKAGRLSIESTGTNHWRAFYAPASGNASAFEIYAATLAGNEVMEVKAGENSGRRLVHDFIVMAMTRAPLARRGENWQGEFELALPAAKTTKTDAGIAVWVTRVGALEPLQATGGWLRIGK